MSTSREFASARETASVVALSTNRKSYEQRILQLVNQARTEEGLRPVSPDARLSAAGQLLADDLAQSGEFSHRDRQGRSVSDRMSLQGYNWRLAAENLAKGQRTPEQVVDQWLHSPKHRQNILKPDVRHLGLGLSECNGQLIWVQVFGEGR